jgi:Skp family chaperone for outer membrane proteins
VDVASIFKKYDKFTRNDALMKEDARDRQKKISQMQQELKGMLDQRNSFKPQSTNYRQKDMEIAQRKAELDLMTDGARREFQQREAELYHQTYKEIESAVAQYADANRINLVLRHSRGDELDPDKPQDVLKQISQQVVYSVRNVDITDTILAMLNRSNGTVQQRQQLQRSNNTPIQTGNKRFNKKLDFRNQFKKNR